LNMKTQSASPSATADREIVGTRLLNAPRDLVFQMWTQPEHIAKWWGPTGFSTTIHEMDVRPGGLFRLTMHGPDGTEYRNRVVYLEVKKPERLVYKYEPGKGDEPASMEVTVTFAAEGNKTRLEFRMVFPSAKAREHVVTKYGAIEGLNQTLGRLEAELAKMV